VSETHKLSDCKLFRHGERFDGSVLMVIRDGEKDVGLYFGRRWREQAAAIRDAVPPA
jgi:ribosomal protein S5